MCVKLPFEMGVLHVAARIRFFRGPSIGRDALSLLARSLRKLPSEIVIGNVDLQGDRLCGASRLVSHTRKTGRIESVKQPSSTLIAV